MTTLPVTRAVAHSYRKRVFDALSYARSDSAHRESGLDWRSLTSLFVAQGEPIFYADFVHDYPKIGGVGEYSTRLFKVLRARYGDRLRSLRAIETKLGPVSPRLSYLDRERLALQRLAIAHPGALVIVPNFQSPVSPAAPKRLRIVNVVHDVPFENLPDEYVNDYHVRLDYLYRETAANADHIAFVSDVTRRHFCGRYGAPRGHSVIAPIMNDMPSAIRIAPKERENFLLAVAHFEFHEHKNFDGLIRLFASLADRDPQLRLVLTGRGRDLFEQTLGDLPEAIRARIDHRGFVPHEELDELYRSARAFVSLSRFEGFDMPSVEAALRGTPLILSDLPVRRELFGDSACIVDPVAPSIPEIEVFLASPLAPQARIAHAMPDAVSKSFAKVVRALEAASKTAAGGWAAQAMPERRSTSALNVRHALLAGTVMTGTLFVGDLSWLCASNEGTRSDRHFFAQAYAQIVVNPNNNYYNSTTPGPSPLDVVSTVNATVRLANDRQALMVTNTVLGGMLLGRNEQINCSDCFTAFGSAGSFSAGFHGRKQLTQDLSIVGGIGFAEYRAGGVHVTSTPIFAGLLRYDWTELGASRPFAEIGSIVSPSQRTVSTRNYGFAQTVGLGRGTSNVFSGTIFGRLGWVWRLTPQDEAAVAVELARGWQRFGGYTESGLPSNPFPLSTPGGSDQMGTVKFGGQWTHLWGFNIETQLNLGVARTFGSRSGVNANFVGGPLGQIGLGEFTFAEYGARVGYRIQQNFIIDVFADGTLAGKPVGNTIHGGVAARYAF